MRYLICLVLITATSLFAIRPISAQEKPKLFEFAGGTVPEFVARIDSHFEMSGSLKELAEIDPDLHSVRVPRIRITRGTPLSALAVYEQLTETNPILGRISIATGENSEIQSLSFLPGEIEAESQIRAHVFSLSPDLVENRVKIAKLFSAADEFASQSGNRSQAVIQFSASLMLVRGRNEQIQLAESILRGIEQERSEIGRIESQMAEFEGELQELRIQREALKDAVAFANDRLTRAKAMAAQGESSLQEPATVEADLREKMSQMQSIEVKMENVGKAMKSLSRERAKWGESTSPADEP